MLIWIAVALAAFAEGGEQPDAGKPDCPKEEPIQDKLPPAVAKILAIRLPAISLENTSLEEAVDFLRHRIHELDPDDHPTLRGIGIIIRKSAGNDPGARLATYSARNERIDDILRELAAVYRIEFHITSIGIVVTDEGVEPFPNLKGKAGKVHGTYKNRPIDGKEAK